MFTSVWQTQDTQKGVWWDKGDLLWGNRGWSWLAEKEEGKREITRCPARLMSREYRVFSSSLNSTMCPPLQWYNRTDYPIFTQYQRYRRLHPMQPFYILHPHFEWQVWQRIQDNMAEPIQKNPPSSGLLGMWSTNFLFLISTHKNTQWAPPTLNQYEEHREIQKSPSEITKTAPTLAESCDFMSPDPIVQDDWKKVFRSFKEW